MEGEGKWDDGERGKGTCYSRGLWDFHNRFCSSVARLVCIYLFV